MFRIFQRKISRNPIFDITSYEKKIKRIKFSWVHIAVRCAIQKSRPMDFYTSTCNARSLIRAKFLIVQRPPTAHGRGRGGRKTTHSRPPNFGLVRPFNFRFSEAFSCENTAEL